MYISRVEIDLNNRQRMKDLRHLGSYHGWVENCFKYEINDSERSRKLWRIDQLRGKVYLLLVSENKPDKDTLEYYGVKDSAIIKDYDKFLNSLENGMRARFRVKLNPTKSVFEKGDKRGRVIPLFIDSEQMRYLFDRSEKNGFSLNSNEFEIVEKGTELFRKRGQVDIRLSKAVFEGYLTITDLDAFKELLTKGLGRKKAYGFGLMTIIPIK